MQLVHVMQSGKSHGVDISMIGSMAISDFHVESIKQQKAAASIKDSLTVFQINADIWGELLCQSCTLA